LGYALHGIENLGPGNTLSTEYLKYPTGTVQRELGRIAYDHDHSYTESLKHPGAFGHAIRKYADSDMREEIGRFRSMFNNDAWQNYIGDIGIGTKQYIDSKLEPYGYTLYDGKKWLTPFASS